MTSCENMKVNEVYKCSICGLALEVKQSCNCKTDPNCETHVSKGVCCDLKCCGKELELA